MRLAVVASPLSLITASAWSSALAQGAPSREATVGPQALDRKLKSICRGC